MKKLAADEIQKKLKTLKGWEIDSAACGIQKAFIFANFSDAVCFLNQVAQIAETEDHHPDLHLTDYKQLRIVLTTHSAGGLTQKDFSVAGQIEEVAGES